MDIPKHYSLRADNPDHFVLHDQRDGAQFKVAKKELHPAHQIKIMKMQKFDEGGDVEDEPDAAIPQALQTPQPNPQANPDVGNISGLMQPQSSAASTDGGASGSWTPQAPQDQAAPQAAQMIAPNQGVTMNDVNKIQNMEASGINQQAQGQMAQNKQFAEVQGKETQRQMDAQQVYEERMNAHNQELDKLSKDIASTKIDPDRYWNSKSTGSKVSTILGVLLSGIGAGVAHSTHNLAWEGLNNSIDKDIEQQKGDLGKKQTLLADNLRIQGNLTSAESATRLQYMSILQGKIAKIAAQSGNPIIQGQAQQRLAELQMKMLPLKQSVAQNETRMRLMNNQGIGTPEQRINMLASSPAESEAAGKELEAVRNHAAQKDNILSAFDRATEENTILGRAGRLGFEGPAMKGYRTLMMPYLKDAEGRINEMELARTDAMLKGVGDKDSSVKEKRSDLVKFLDEKKPPTAHLQKFGIDPDKFGKMDSQGRSKFKEGPVK